MLADMGIPKSEIEQRRSSNSLGASEVWRRQRIIIGLRAGVSDEQIENLGEDGLPSLTLKQEVTTRQRRAARADGGNFPDSALACLALYADVTNVDKRTYEYIRQIKGSNNRLKPVLKTITRWSKTADVLKNLEMSFT